MKRLVVDLDNTITIEDESPYSDKIPNLDVIAKLREYKYMGFEIVIFTARNMRTYEGSLGAITKHTVPVILDWLTKHDVPFDELLVGKPWCGKEGFYVDDRAVRPSEFVKLSPKEIQGLIQ